MWNAQVDEFGLKLEARGKTPKDLTKRIILSQVIRIYDPLELTTPFTIQAMVMMRELSMEKAGFDDPVFRTLQTIESYCYNTCY